MKYKKKKTDARRFSLLVLQKVEEEGAYLNLALANLIKEYELDDRERRLATEITYGVITHKLALKCLIEKITGRPAEKLDRPVLLVLYIGFYQLFYLERIPEWVVVNTTVELIKKTKKRALAPFVNGVMRAALRRKGKMDPAGSGAGKVRYLSCRYSHPEWMVRRWLKRYGSEETEKLLAANNMKSTVAARVNTLRLSRRELVALLAKENIKASESDIVPEGILLESAAGITSLGAYRQGMLQLQGESAMLVSRVLDPVPGSRVLDVCSAPGGKTAHMAALMSDQGEIIALDIHEHRLKLVQANAKRLGIGIIKTKLWDGRKPLPGRLGFFDYILLDVPCSGLGVIRKRPDIKWRRKEEDIAKLASDQLKLLCNAAAVLQTKGVLVYSACTNEPEETEMVISAFLEKNRDFCAVSFAEYLPEKWRGEKFGLGLQLTVHRHGVEGFYISKLIKNG